MAMSVGGGGGMSAEPNVVPMIDILLVLLIIFMVAQPMDRKAMNIQVAPPDTRTQAQPDNNQIVLELPDARASGASSIEVILYDQAGNASSTRLQVK